MVAPGPAVKFLMFSSDFHQEESTSVFNRLTPAFRHWDFRYVTGFCKILNFRKVTDECVNGAITVRNKFVIIIV